MISVFSKVEHIVGKGENTGKQHFLLLSHNVFYSLTLYKTTNFYTYELKAFADNKINVT